LKIATVTPIKSNEVERFPTSWVFELDPVNSYAYWEDAFSKEECELLIDIGNTQKKVAGSTVNKPETNPNLRKSEVSWLYPNNDNKWAYERLTSIITDLNNRFFKFDIFGVTEGFQFTKYSAPGGKYGKHVDCVYNGQVRKLSFTLQLSDPSSYEGGDLSLHLNDSPTLMSRVQGSVALFPSYVLHEVTPVTKGTRYSLVSWVTGKPFK
jgi:PKHD-type hydroxylase